jgi:hypothetical protein
MFGFSRKKSHTFGSGELRTKTYDSSTHLPFSSLPPYPRRCSVKAKSENRPSRDPDKYPELHISICDYSLKLYCRMIGVHLSWFGDVALLLESCHTACTGSHLDCKKTSFNKPFQVTLIFFFLNLAWSIILGSI